MLLAVLDASHALIVDPGTDVGAAVDDTAAETEADRSDPKVSPVAERRDGSTEQLGRFREGEQVVQACWGLLGHWGLIGHGRLRIGWVVVASYWEKAPNLPVL
jgi:hypothetical protein